MLEISEPAYSIDDLKLFMEENDNFRVFGTGFEAIRIKRGLESIGKRVLGFLSYRNRHMTLDGIPVSTISEDDSTIMKNVIIASLQENGADWEISASKQLINRHNMHPFKDFISLMGFFIGMEHYSRYRMLLGKEFYSYFTANREGFLKAAGILSDEYSKDIYKKVIAYKAKALEAYSVDTGSLPCTMERYEELLRNEGLYSKRISLQVSENTRKNAARNLSVRPYSYFDIVKPEGKKVIIDAGAFHGDTAIMFSHLSPDAEIYCFEPVKELYAKLIELKDYFKKMHPVGLGLWSRKADLPFTIMRRDDYIGVGSFIGEGRDSIPVISLDEFAENQGIGNIDFIKMDIEGAEMEALKGAENVIANNLPDLSICIYHEVSHLWKIPLWIKERFPEYNIYIDHKGIHPAETVCYATVGRA